MTEHEQAATALTGRRVAQTCISRCRILVMRTAERREGEGGGWPWVEPVPDWGRSFHE
jgi:hypothetical protein